MSWAPVNISDSGTTNVNSGSSWNATAIATTGNTVLLGVICNDSAGGKTVSGLGATWLQVSGTVVRKGTGSSYSAWWVGTGCVVTDQAITITTNAGVAYCAIAYEVAGVTSIVAAGTPTEANTGGNTGSGYSMTTNSAANGNMLIALTSAGASISAGPNSLSSPVWTDYNAGGFAWAQDNDAAYLTVTSTGTYTVYWKLSVSANWDITAVLLTSGANSVTAEPIVMVI